MKMKRPDIFKELGTTMKSTYTIATESTYLYIALFFNETFF